MIEKCIRCASKDSKRAIILELTIANKVESMLRDQYANYVVQTAMDFADEDLKPTVIENIRPIVPSIRNTPYGRRVQHKIAEYDDAQTLMPSPPAPVPDHSAQMRTNRMGVIGVPPGWGYSNGNMNGYGAHGAGMPAPAPRTNGIYMNGGFHEGGYPF